MRKNRLNTVNASDSIQQERLPGSLEVGRIHFKSLDLSMQRRSLKKKQTNCKCKSRSVYKIPSFWNNLFRDKQNFFYNIVKKKDKQIICLHQADSTSRLYAKEFTFDKASSINILFTTNCVAQMELILVLFLV